MPEPKLPKAYSALGSSIARHTEPLPLNVPVRFVRDGYAHSGRFLCAQPGKGCLSGGWAASFLPDDGRAPGGFFLPYNVKVEIQSD